MWCEMIFQKNTLDQELLLLFHRQKNEDKTNLFF